jgi:hypothetical protein
MKAAESEGARRRDSSSTFDPEEDDVERLLAHVSNDAVCMVHDAMMAHLRDVLLRLSANLSSRRRPGGTADAEGASAQQPNILTMLGGQVIIQPDNEEEGREPPPLKRRRTGDNSVTISRLDLHEFAAHHPVAHTLLGDDQERLLERASLLL